MTTSPSKLLSLARESGGAVHDMGRGLYAVTFGEVSLPEFVERIRQDEREKADSFRLAVRRITALLRDGEWADALSVDADICALEEEVRKLVERQRA
jgi:hypothetical protein